jgi:hypothetical protein
VFPYLAFVESCKQKLHYTTTHATLYSAEGTDCRSPLPCILFITWHRVPWKIGG